MGSNPIFSAIYRGIAQLVEQRSPKPRVLGSSPSTPAKEKSAFVRMRIFLCIIHYSLFIIHYSLNKERIFKLRMKNEVAQLMNNE